MSSNNSWNGFKLKTLTIGNRVAKIVFPNKSNRKWLMKTEYFGAFPGLEIEMLKRGYHVAYIENSTRWCKEADLDAKASLADFLVREYNLSRKCVPVGMSCGGMQAVYFAAKYPEHVAALYLDAPVINLLSCPADLGLAKSNLLDEFQRDMGISISQLIGYRGHPLDKIPTLLENKIPIILVCGDSDTVVPYCENGQLLHNLYTEHGGTIKTIIKPGCAHHPHGLDDNTPIIEFIMNYI